MRVNYYLTLQIILHSFSWAFKILLLVKDSNTKFSGVRQKADFSTLNCQLFSASILESPNLYKRLFIKTDASTLNLSQLNSILKRLWC